MHTLFADKKFVPDYKELTPGTTVKIHQQIREGDKSRTQIYEGIILRRHGKKTVDATITVFRKAANNIGVTRIFPLFSPLILKIEIVKRAKNVRRAKLNYLPKIVGDAIRTLKTTQIGKEITIHPNTVPKKAVVENEEKSE